jgi:hypothetical protein
LSQSCRQLTVARVSGSSAAAAFLHGEGTSPVSTAGARKILGQDTTLLALVCIDCIWRLRQSLGKRPCQPKFQCNLTDQESDLVFSVMERPGEVHASRLLPASSGCTHLVLKSPTVLTDVENGDSESN